MHACHWGELEESRLLLLLLLLNEEDDYCTLCKRAMCLVFAGLAFLPMKLTMKVDLEEQRHRNTWAAAR
jgi:hypothetical protein